MHPFGLLPDPPSVQDLLLKIRSLEKELDQVNLDAERDRKAHRQLLERFMALVTEVHQIRDDLNGTVRRLDLLQTTSAPATPP